jgi:hypothetical protein
MLKKRCDKYLDNYHRKSSSCDDEKDLWCDEEDAADWRVLSVDG